jgi:hypothetical protein
VAIAVRSKAEDDDEKQPDGNRHWPANAPRAWTQSQRDIHDQL